MSTAPSEELDSMPLSTLSLDESGSLEITQSAHVPLATSTPTSTTLHQQDSSLSADYDQETDIDSSSECTVIPTANTDMKAPAANNIPTSIEGVGCTFVTTCLYNFLEHLSSFTNKQIFEEVYYILSVLDQYLYDNPSRYTHCMSANNEFTILLREALCIHADITVFPTIWAVLSIFLDTQDSTAEYVQYFQQEYNEYYNVKPDKQM